MLLPVPASRESAFFARRHLLASRHLQALLGCYYQTVVGIGAANEAAAFPSFRCCRTFAEMVKKAQTFFPQVVLGI